MKLFAPALIFCGASAFCQAPQVPHKMEFAGMTLSIRDDARREIQADVDALTRSQKYFMMKVERARTYFPIIEKIFAEERLPLDFKYLSLQESALVSDAVSSSQAVGFWQFKDFTAREMGLRVDDDVDERMNIASASRGAAKYIKQCNHYFNNWIYALQSYQMGAGGVMRMVGDTHNGSRHMEITSDTYWYVKKFLAHKVAFEGVTSEAPSLPVQVVTPEAGLDVKSLADTYKVSSEELLSFNKWLKSGKVPADKSYVLIIPGGKTPEGFQVLTVSNKPVTPTEKKEPMLAETMINGLSVITARTGETMAGLADRAGIRLSAFLRYNEISIDHAIKGGERFFLERKKKTGDGDLYTLKAGENLWQVSQRFGIRLKSLRKLNRIESSSVAAGTTLSLKTRKLEAAAPSEIVQLDDDSFDWSIGDSSMARRQETKAENIGDVHEVKASDTLYSVARQYGVTVQDLMNWNNKQDSQLKVGERLRVRMP